MEKLYYCVGYKHNFQEYHFGGKMHIPNEKQLKHCAPFSLQDKGNDFAICSAKYMAIQKATKQVCVHLLGRSVTIYGNIYNRFAYYSNIENTLLGMGDR